MWHELPHEQSHDAFGVFVAKTLFGQRQLLDELADLRRDDTRLDHARLRYLLTEPPFEDNSTLRARLAAFAGPYATALSALWTADSASAESSGNTSITQLAPHIQDLFK
ncbi:MAG: hypothetical protein ACREPM_09955 [Gemmatimonadaceae bacterium]